MATAKKKRRCTGKTKAGKRCKAAPLKGQKTCLAHADEETRDSMGFGGAQEGSGAPRKPKATEVLRAKLEDDIEKWLQPYEDALEADRGVVVGAGEDAEIEYVPDHRARMRASREVLDRVYGRPAIAVELTGRAGGPVKVSEEQFLDPKTRAKLDAVVLAVGAERDAADGDR